MVAERCLRYRYAERAGKLELVIEDGTTVECNLDLMSNWWTQLARRGGGAAELRHRRAGLPGMADAKNHPVIGRVYEGWPAPRTEQAPLHALADLPTSKASVRGGGGAVRRPLCPPRL